MSESEPAEQEVTEVTQTETPPKPAETTRQPIEVRRPEPPQFKIPDRITRARASAEALDTTLAAGGALKSLIEDVTGVAEDTARENFQLRNEVNSQGQSLGNIGFWANWSTRPESKDYPVAQAQQDFAAIQKDIKADPYYAQADPAWQDIAARERFFAEARVKTPSKEASEQPKAQPRQVGSTRAIPRGTQTTTAPPPKKATVAEMLESGKLPDGMEQQIESEMAT